MKPVSIILFAALFAASGLSQAVQRGNCTERGNCLVAPVPPVPPAPPAAPAPPAPPAPPALPALPAPPPMPTIPEAAHDACASKAVGAGISWTDNKGLRIKGTCERDSKGMYLEATSIHSKS